MRGEAIPHIRHVAEIDRRIANYFDRKIVQLRNGFRAGVQVEVILEFPDLGRAGRENQVLLAHCCDHIGCGKSLRLQQTRLDVDHDLPLFPPIGKGDHCPGNRHKLSSEKIESNII